MLSRALKQAISRTALPAGRRAIACNVGSISNLPSRLPIGRNMSMAADTTISNPAMFCRQCEQTQDHIACRTVGICGKSPETSTMQDVLMHTVKSVSLWAVAAREAGASADEMKEANSWTLSSVFSTLTNVNFDESRIAEYIKEGMTIKRDLEQMVRAKGGVAPDGDVARLDLSKMDTDELEDFGYTVSIPELQKAMGNDDCFSLVEIASYGAKGACAYAAHCRQLGYVDEDVMTGIHHVFAKVASNEPDMEGLLANALRVGELNGKILEMLDTAHAATFGAPEPTQVKVTATKGKCILVSGHDLLDLETLLKQTEGKGVNVYTHGEMLPAHGYPGLKKYPHLVGNYGTAWQNQKFEFALFPGPVVVTTNCILEPRRKYKDRLYSINEVGVAGVKHIKDGDFSEVIEQAQSCKGFPRTIDPAEYLTVGFNHRAVLPLAGKVIDAVQNGHISRIFLIGGCDGSQFDRNYFTELAEELPDDTLILTLGCAKNRFIHSKKLLGQTLANGMPRILDMGQCNDSYSAIVVATELAKALDCTVNDLPLSLCLSHLEQKAAAVLLTLLQMGVKNIRLGPSLPAYITPNVLDVLVQNYNIMPTGDVQGDIKMMMEGK
uniref:Hydroxylamine reductase n=1 Tax=Skeletonema marinoi TaxID=267567 RepID=A0A7S2KX37_9STRA|mmetsp:Transcript_18025/g.30547  ORF Transcript_18025/g.30547 Transcript_18025/m.30547 type:complete len:609 (+) Transcript_18025:87-1913(+)